jgi:type IV secretory pathway TrbL component
MPPAFRAWMINCPSSEPSVSIFEPTRTGCAEAASGSAARASASAAQARRRKLAGMGHSLRVERGRAWSSVVEYAGARRP